jgi:hypothetical protein
MFKNIITEYREEDYNTRKPRRKIAQDFGMGSDVIALDPSASTGVMESAQQPMVQQNMVMDFNYSKDGGGSIRYDEDEAIMPGENDYYGVIGRSSDDQSYEDDDDADVMQAYEEEHYHEHDGEAHQEGEVFVEGDAEEVLEELGKRLPGVDVVIKEEEEEEEEETDWENHRDPKHFMVYITKQYPQGIPKHDGTSTLGCERAILFLNKLNKEISEALRADKDDLLDIPQLENIRVNLVRDVTTLTNHANGLKRKLKEAKDSEEVAMLKTASTPNIQLVVTPFERAIAGIITNAVVSAGKPFEDVYEFLKKKYSLDEREELSIFQLLKDMGHPIFKDRGTLGKGEKKENGQGVEFIKNYFA